MRSVSAYTKKGDVYGVMESRDTSAQSHHRTLVAAQKEATRCNNIQRKWGGSQSYEVVKLDPVKRKDKRLIVKND